MARLHRTAVVTAAFRALPGHLRRRAIALLSGRRTVANSPSTSTARISCVVCAYNEASRIRPVLEAVRGHPALAEVIVVNDGSTDGTDAVVGEYPDIRLISYTPNQGKTYALSRGIAAASGDYLMLLDADLAGVTAADIQALADPVISRHAQASISLRANSLPFYRWIGLDFVSGERVIPTRLVGKALRAMEGLPRWGGEAFINNLIIDEGLSVAVVDWPGVFNTPKTAKVGAWRGMSADLEMVGEAVGFLSPLGVVRQNLALLILASNNADDEHDMAAPERGVQSRRDESDHRGAQAGRDARS